MGIVLDFVRGNGKPILSIGGHVRGKRNRVEADMRATVARQLAAFDAMAQAGLDDCDRATLEALESLALARMGAVTP